MITMSAMLKISRFMLQQTSLSSHQLSCCPGNFPLMCVIGTICNDSTGAAGDRYIQVAGAVSLLNGLLTEEGEPHRVPGGRLRDRAARARAHVTGSVSSRRAGERRATTND